MKVLAIIGSPRKKNTFNIVKMFEDEFKKHENIDFQYLFLNEVNLDYCIGCSSCKNDEYLCPLKDDTIKIKKIMENSNIIIFASPVYENNISALMKNFFDRFHYLCFRPFDKNIFSITIGVTAFTGLKFILKYINILSLNFGLKNIGILGLSGQKYNIDTKYKQVIEYKIKTIVNNFYNPIKEKPKIFDLLVFKDQKDRILKIKDKYPKAYNYWLEKGWLNKNYFYDLKINPLKKLLVKFMKLPISKN